MTDTRTFDAGILSRGWLATHLATGVDEETPILFGTLLIEDYADGVRLVATDRTLLLSTWVPVISSRIDDGDGPPLDEAPRSATVVRDPDNRGRALLTYLRKVAAKAAKDDQPAPEVALHIGVPAEDEGNDVGFPGMELKQVVIEYVDHERVALPIVEGTFPDYRSLLIKHETKKTDVVSLGSENMARLGQVGKTIGSYVRCALAGPKGAIGIEVGVFPPAVRGVVMPVAVADVAIAAAS